MDAISHLQMLVALGFVRAPREKKKNQTPKPKITVWFEACTVDELKKLCRAAKVSCSGTKSALVDNLCNGEYSKKYCSNNEVYLEHLKQQCREQGLQVSGKRYELVLRLLQNETGAGGQPKRAAGEMDDHGNFQPKKRAKSMKLPNVAKLEERAYKKAFPPDEVKHKWSNWTHKDHCRRCILLAIELIKKEVEEKELFLRGQEELAWQVIYAVTRWIVELHSKPKPKPKVCGQWVYPHGPMVPPGMGAAHYEMVHSLFPSLVRAMQATSSKERVHQLAGKFLRDLEAEAHDYGTDCPKFSAALDEYVPGIPRKRKST